MNREHLVYIIISDYLIIYGVDMPEEEIEHLTDLDVMELTDIYNMQKDDLNK